MTDAIAATCAIEGHDFYNDGLDKTCARCRMRLPRTAEELKRRKPAISIPATPACPHYTRNQGCPLHGETCAPDYR